MIERVAFLSIHTSPLAAPGSGDAGGMNVYVDSVARTFSAMGIEVDVFTARSDDGHEGTTVVAPGYRVIHVDALGDDRAQRVGAFSEAVIRHAMVEGKRYDILHSHYWLSAWAGVLLERPLAAPLVISFHTLGRVRDVGAGEPPTPLVRIATETEVIAHAGCVVASTPADAVDLMERYGAHPERVCVSAPGVDHGVFHKRPQRRDRLGLPSGPLAAVVGRIQPLKRIDLAIEAIAAIPDASLVVVGGPSGPVGAEELAGLRDLADRVAPGRIHFRDAMQHDEAVADLFASVDVVVVPSRAESFGLVAVEAQACGTPVVASNVGGLAHAVADGESGYLIDGDDLEEWSGRIKAVLGDPELRERLGTGAMVHASQFSWSATAARLLELYEGLV
jgi:D-inositol-3-phosphate glycosyltransferase